jgi:Zn-dependent peptidase ImmA (M78 family)
MTAKRTWPRSQAQHESAAADVLRRYAVKTGWKRALPVPVSDIIERLFDLSILYEPIDELPGEVILGALSPEAKIICLNERHLDIFDQWVGPETFTLAHELGHWVYDAVDPNQGDLFSEPVRTVFCRRIDQGDESSDIREMNSNKFAACLMLPAEVVKTAVTEPFGSWSKLGTVASAWGVSKTTMRIRLETLGMEALLP